MMGSSDVVDAGLTDDEREASPSVSKASPGPQLSYHQSPTKVRRERLQALVARSAKKRR